MLSSAGFEVELLEFYDREGKFHRKEWDLSRGTIGRRVGSTEERPSGGVIQYTSLIADAHKPAR